MQNTLLSSYLLIEIGVRFMGAETGIHETQRIELDLTRRYTGSRFRECLWVIRSFGHCVVHLLLPSGRNRGGLLRNRDEGECGPKQKCCGNESRGFMDSTFLSPRGPFLRLTF
jgi:hypothetical protein